MTEWRDELDKALDDALASYGETPENLSLERRILAKVGERTQRRRSVLRLALGISTLAAAMLCLMLWPAPRIAAPTRQVETAAIVTPTREFARLRPVSIKPRRSTKKVTEPKLQQFPAPSPMTSEERALVQLASGNAKDIPRELTEFGKAAVPIEVPAVEIKPLD